MAPVEGSTFAEWRSVRPMAAGARLALFIVAGVALGGCSGSDRPELSDGSFPARTLSAIAVTDDGVFLFGGRLAYELGGEPPRDAVIVDSTSGERTPLPLAPYGIDEATAVSVGDKVVVTGIGCADVVDEGQERECEPGGRASLVYDIGGRDWQELAGPEGPNAALHATILGVTSENRVVATQYLNLMRPLLLWTLTPGEDAWEPVPSPGVRGDDVCLAGDRLVVATADRVGPPNDAWGNIERDPVDSEVIYGDSYRDPRLHVLDLTADDPAWSPSSPLPGGRGRPSISCMGDRVLLETAYDSAVHDLGSGGWRAVEGPRGSIRHGDELWTGDEVVVLRPADSGTYDPDTDEWTPGLSLEQWWGVTWTGDELARYDPEQPELVELTPLPD